MYNASPDTVRTMRAMDVTWPAARRIDLDGWTLRRDCGGGHRVTAASGHGNISDAEEAMLAWGQTPLFRIDQGHGAGARLDAGLAASGYYTHEPVILYAAPCEAIAGERSHMAAAYRCHCRPAIMDDIWRCGDIGPARLAIMDRVTAPKMLLMSRVGDRPAGVAFVAVDADVAMIHAIEVLKRHRRGGAARLLIEVAARFAQENGATWLTLAVTEANGPARKLYEALGMHVAGAYHYRIKKGGSV